jgi:hypothetical protein
MPIEFIPILRLDTVYGHCDELKVEFHEMDLIATVQYYRTAGTFSRTFTFGFVQAHSLYSEMLMPLTARHCVDQLCEVAGSEWVARYRQRVSSDLRGLRHYAIHFTKCGYLEVLSHQFEAGPEFALAAPART